jgi:RNA polymerase sigma-70 factor (ECF subfamily)
LKGSWDGDRDPLAALRRGDPRLLEAFVEAEAGSFLRFFRRLGASLHEAEDLVQEVFLKLYRSAPTYDPRSAFGAFALRVARNAWIDRRRRRGVRPEGPALDELEGAAGSSGAERFEARSDPSHASERGEELERVARAMASLSAAHAEVIELAILQALPYAQIAQVLDIPVGTVKSRVFHAVRHLRAQLDQDEGGA